jgi:hypothetical protein
LAAHPSSQEQVNVLVQKRLVLLVGQAKALEKLVRQPHELLHPHVLLLVKRNAQEVQHDRVDAHVPEQTLLVTPSLEYALDVAGGGVRVVGVGGLVVGERAVLGAEVTPRLGGRVDRVDFLDAELVHPNEDLSKKEETDHFVSVYLYMLIQHVQTHTRSLKFNKNLQMSLSFVKSSLLGPIQGLWT